jgi:Ca2+-binding RTX toxin-like protein
MATFNGTNSNNTIVGSNSPDLIDGKGGNDLLFGYGNGSGVGGSAPAIDPAGGGAADHDSLQGGDGNDTVRAGGGNDTVAGGNGNDSLDAGTGNDRVTGGADNDSMDGGAGSDTYQVSGTGDGFDSYHDSGGAADFDRILALAAGTRIGLLSGFGAVSGIEAIDANGLAGVYIAGGSGAETLDFSATALVGIDHIEGGVSNDTITGSAGAGRILGGGGNDKLTGGGGNDTLVGGAGNDTQDGGAGSDVYQVGGTGDGFDLIKDTGSAADHDVIQATADGTRIGLASGFGPGNGIEEINGGGKAGVVIAGDGASTKLDFSSMCGASPMSAGQSGSRSRSCSVPPEPLSPRLPGAPMPKSA